MTRRTRERRGTRRSWLDACLSVLLGTAVLALVAVAAGGLAGFRLVSIRSGSMTPALRVGDLVLTRSEPPARLHTGDIVTFQHPELGVLVTHRVVAVHATDGWVQVTTKGDANQASESWRVPATGRIGYGMLRVPVAGRLSPQLVASVAIIVAGVLLAGWVLRWIWNSPTRGAPNRTRHARVRGSGHV